VAKESPVRFGSAAAAAVILAAVTLTACSGSSVPAPASPGSARPSAPSATAPASSTAVLKETGSSLLYPLFNIWATAYHSQFPRITITTASTGSGAGLTAAADGKADVGASDAYLSSANVAASPDLENIPLAISAQQVSYNLPDLKTSLRLNGTVLAQMYQGTITSWNDPAIAKLNPGVTLPPTRVVPLHRSDSSGDTFLFTTYLSRQDPAWSSSVSYGTTVAWPSVPGALAAKGNTGMVSSCAAHPGCVAYIGISYESQTAAAGLGQAALLDDAGSYQQPTAATIGADAAGFASTTPASGTLSLIDGTSAGAYPLVNYEYAIVSTSQPTTTKATDLQALLNWILTTGQQSTYLAQVNFQPLPPSVVAIAQALTQKITS
jgi:phosphate transport system substrate-binding protein